MSTRTVSHIFEDWEGRKRSGSLTLQNTADNFTYKVDGEWVWSMNAEELRNLHKLMLDVAEGYL